MENINTKIVYSIIAAIVFLATVALILNFVQGLMHP